MRLIHFDTGLGQDQSAPSEGEAAVATGVVKLCQKGELFVAASDCLYFECERHCSSSHLPFYFLLDTRTRDISESEESHQK